jgi:hypothetical protein
MPAAPDSEPLLVHARPISGEIMTGWPAAAAPRGLSPSSDVVDADYQVLERRAPEADSAPPQQPTCAAPQVAPPPGGMAMLRPAGPPRPFSVRGGPLFWAAGLAGAFVAFWIAGGHAVIRHSVLSGASSPAGTAFSIAGVTSRVDLSGQKPVLFVDGEAGNDGAVTALLPPLEIRVTGEDGAVTRYTLGTSGRPLAPGQRFAFSSRLDVPRNGVKAVAVSFAE